MAGIHRSGADHQLVGVPDGGFGHQAYCSCGWRTSPKDTISQAAATWQTHRLTRAMAKASAA